MVTTDRVHHRKNAAKEVKNPTKADHHDDLHDIYFQFRQNSGNHVGWQAHTAARS
jgi:hypothetical protein